MDYKYIEQLLERYWQCLTTLDEEQILRVFFRQDTLPESLRRYAPLFRAQEEERLDAPLDDLFDTKIMSRVESGGMNTAKTVKARKVKITTRLLPLFKAAAVVALIVTVGNTIQFSMTGKPPSEDINYAAIKESYEDPAAAYNKVQRALLLLSDGLNAAESGKGSTFTTQPEQQLASDTTALR